MRRRGASEIGSVTLFMAIMAPVLLVGLTGLVFDGGGILNTKREAMNVAAQAARAGAQGLATEDVRGGGGGVQSLDPARAEARAQEYLLDAGHTGSVTVSGDVVRVSVTIARPAQVLPFGTTVVTGTSEARNVRGVVEAES